VCATLPRRTAAIADSALRAFMPAIAKNEIDRYQRETFAYACEAYSRLLELGRTPSICKSLLLELTGADAPPEDRVKRDEYVDILTEAASARNGWKRILARCAPERP
jgi:hypothetical protein